VTLALTSTLLGVGFLSAFFAGLLGIGGALVMIPLLLYVPPLVGVGQLDIKAVAGITMAEVFVAALFGFLAHRRHRTVNSQIAAVGGVASTAGSFVGALLSKTVDDTWLLLVFAAIATVGAALILLPGGLEEVSATGDAPRYSSLRIAVVSGGVGLAAGFVGAGGAFLLVPLLVVVVGVPIRATIGSSLGITALSATAGFLGKLVSHQIPFGPALVVAVGAIPGAQLGAMVSRHVSSRHLKQALSITIVAAAVRVWWDVFGPIALVTIPVGFALGLVLGATGMGSGVLIVPLSYAVLDLDYSHAVALALICTIIARSFGVLTYRGWRRVRWTPVLLYGLVGALGAVLGARMVYTAPAAVQSAYPYVLAGILLVLALLLAGNVLVWPSDGGGDSAPPGRVTPLAVAHDVATQLAVSGLVGLTAIGSGSLVIFSQFRMFQVPVVDALESAFVLAMMMVVPAGVTHLVLGSVDWRFVGLLTAGAMVGSVVSPSAGRLVRTRTVNLVLAGFVVIGAVLTVLRAMATGGS